MGGFWTIFFLLVVLKIPVLGSLALVWWAARAEPADEELEDDGGHRFPRRGPSRPRGPRRRDPHGGAAQPLPDCPPGGRRRTIPPLPARAGLAHARGAAEPARREAP